MRGESIDTMKTIHIPHEALGGAIRALEGVSEENRLSAIETNLSEPQGQYLRFTRLEQAKLLGEWANELRRLSVDLCNGYSDVKDALGRKL